jgi:CRP-like cAMP-binding protein
MMMIEKLLVLRSVPLFAAVRDEYLSSVAAAATELALAAGATLFEEGDAGDALYVIASGRLSVRVQGREINTVGECEVAGEMAVLDPEPRSATLVAIGDCRLLRITGEDLEALMAADDEVARGIIQMLCRRLRQRDMAV